VFQYDVKQYGFYFIICSARHLVKKITFFVANKLFLRYNTLKKKILLIATWVM